MIFLNGLALTSLAAVLVAAVIALFSPSRRLTVVSSLQLWSEVIERAEGRRKRQPRLTAVWVLLLAGAAAAGVALARPALVAECPRRTVALLLYPSAELANPPGPQRLRDAAEGVLARLSDDDRVQVVLPVGLGGASGYLSVKQARQAVGRVEPMRLAAERLVLPAPGDEVQISYRIGVGAPAGPAWPGAVDVPVAATTPEVTLDAVAAVELPSGESQLFVAVRNHASAERDVTLTVTADGAPPVERTFRVAGGARRAEVVALPTGCRAAEVSVGPGVGQRAALRLVEHPKLKLALIGRPDPMLRRFTAAFPQAVVTADAAEADVVLCVGSLPGADAAGVVFDPPVPPAGWRLAGEPVGPINLADADRLADAPLLEGVDLSAVAVRRARPFIPTATATGERLLGVGADVLLLATDRPRRLYVAFDSAADNTNFALDESFLALLVNALDWLAPPGAGRGRQWALADGVVGLAVPPAEPPSEPSAIALPPPRPEAVSRELWSPLAAAAAALWLLGWWVRVR